MRSSSPEAETFVRRCRPLLGTYVEVAVPSACASTIDTAFAVIRKVHRRMSFHEETSDLAAMRRAPAGRPVGVAPQTAAVLRAAIEFHRRSGGVFDVSIGGSLVAAGFLPRPPAVDLSCMRGTTSDLEVVGSCHAICHRPMLVDLGGIAKGYAVDQAVEALRALGVPCGIVNAGGDLRTFGPREQVVHLRGADGAIDGVVALTDAAMASSSNRHLRRIRHGRETSPHLNGRGGAMLALGAVTVIAPTCMTADAMTKVALVDPPMAASLLRSIGGEIVERQELQEG